MTSSSSYIFVNRCTLDFRALIGWLIVDARCKFDQEGQ